MLEFCVNMQFYSSSAEFYAGRCVYPLVMVTLDPRRATIKRTSVFNNSPKNSTGNITCTAITCILAAGESLEEESSSCSSRDFPCLHYEKACYPFPRRRLFLRQRLKAYPRITDMQFTISSRVVGHLCSASLGSGHACGRYVGD